MQNVFSQTEINNITEEIRKERNRLLVESDFSQLSDSPLSEEQKEEWRVYRQALRDITSQDGFPLNVVFPTKLI